MLVLNDPPVHMQVSHAPMSVQCLSSMTLLQGFHSGGGGSGARGDGAGTGGGGGGARGTGGGLLR
jgi:hypothetical protein